MNIQPVLAAYRKINFQPIHLDGLPRLNRSFSLQGIANGYTGYGQHTCHIARSFADWGYGIRLKALGPVEALLPVTMAEHNTPPVLAVQPIAYAPEERVQFWFTMHESTRLPDRFLAHLEHAEQIIVPSTWNASCFSAQGVTAPIHVCPLGVDTDLFSPAHPPDDCVFGVAGNPSLSIAERKNLALALKAFGLAFPGKKDVRLRVKTLPSCVLPVPADERIDVAAAVWTDHQLADWMRGLTAFILPSRSEAWGFFALQAMACGVPVIAAAFGGVLEYLSHDNGYLVDYRLVPANDPFYEGVGLWADLKLEEMVEQLRAVYTQQGDAAERGRRARQQAERLTWTAANEKLESILLAHGFFSQRSRKKSRVRSDRETIIDFYRRARRTPKKPLRDFTDYTLTNTPTGLGDTLLLTSIPWLADRQGKVRYIHHDSPHFAGLMEFNPHYRPLRADAPRIEADVLQRDYDMGNGHFIQRLQRAMGLYPERKPKGSLNIEHKPVKNRIVLHFEPGRHAQWQAQHVHPRARQIYPETQAVLQEFVHEHPDYEFFEVGKATPTLSGVELANLPLQKTIELLATCEYFIGIISGPMHLATALGVRCVVLINFPAADRIYLPTLVDINQVESEWFYPQNVLLHQEGAGKQVRRFSKLNLEKALAGEVYPYWTDNYLDLIYEQLI